MVCVVCIWIRQQRIPLLALLRLGSSGWNSFFCFFTVDLKIKVMRVESNIFCDPLIQKIYEIIHLLWLAWLSWQKYDLLNERVANCRFSSSWLYSRWGAPQRFYLWYHANTNKNFLTFSTNFGPPDEHLPTLEFWCFDKLKGSSWISKCNLVKNYMPTIALSMLYRPNYVKLGNICRFLMNFIKLLEQWHDTS